MVRRLILLGVLVGLALVAASPGVGATQGGSGSFRITGTILRALDGATVEARLAGGKLQRVSLVGVTAPTLASGACFAAEARDRLARLAAGRRATLIGDPARKARTGATTIPAYVDYAGGDLGRKLIAGGFARTDTAVASFGRKGAYQAAEAEAKTAGLGLWTTCATPAAPPTAPAATPPPPPPPPADPSPPPPPAAPPAPDASPPPPPAAPPAPPPPPPGPSCDPSYPSMCIAPPPPTLSCGDVSEHDFPVDHSVPNADPHGFDPDGNGIGCQSPCPNVPGAPAPASSGQVVERRGRRRRKP